MGYLGGHWDGCSCVHCLRQYELHNAGYEPCVCAICEAHNLVNNNAFQMAGGKVVPAVATVNFCERCESMGKSNAMGAVSYNTNPAEGQTRIEICPGCVGDFMVWLKEDIMTDREKAYREPWKKDEDESGEIANKKKMREFVRELMAGSDDEE